MPGRARGAKQRARAAELSQTRRLVYAAFLLSGFAGLVHQVTWAKLLVQLIGSGAPAQAAVLAVFIGGLALGALLAGRFGERFSQPLRVYAWLEFAIAAYGLLLTFLLDAAGAGYLALARLTLELPVLALPLRLGLTALALLPPALLMGATMPLLARQLVQTLAETRARVASLYALNAFGAMLGAGFAGFVALPAFGVQGALWLACALNVAAGALVLRPAARAAPALARTPASAATGRGETASARPRRGERVALAALACSGFAALGYEVLYTRVVALAFGASAYSFSLMLMAFLAGIGLGGAWVGRLDVRRPLWLFGATQLAAASALLAATPLVARLPYWITLVRLELQERAFGFELYEAAVAGLCLAVLLVPTTCLGFGFPLVAELRVRGEERVGRGVGSAYAWNTAGNVLGALVTALVLLPWLGLLGAFHLCVALNLAAGAALLASSGELRSTRSRALLAAAALVAGLYLGFGTHWVDPVRLAPAHIGLRTTPDSLPPERRALHPASSYAAWRRFFVIDSPAELHFFQEDAHASVIVFGRDRILAVNGKPDASLHPEDLETQLLLAHLPLFLAPDARSLLVVGYGAGLTTGSALRHPLERADVVEISPAVLAADRVFAAHNYRALADARVRVHVDDALSFLRTSSGSWDAIISEPSNPWVVGVGSLFTLEFFESVRARLRPGGVFCLWFHNYAMSDEMTELVLRTLGAVFPQVRLFADRDLGNVMALASVEPLAPDFARLEARFAEPGVRADLKRIGIRSLAALLSHERIPAGSAMRLVAPGPLNRARHERLEYAAPRSLWSGERSRWFERNDALLSGLPPTGELLFDRYLASRQERGDPVRIEELVDVASYLAEQRGAGEVAAQAVLERFDRPAPAGRAR